MSKTIISILISLILNTIVFAYDSDTIKLRVLPDTIYKSSYDDTISFIIYNDGADTLIMMNEFYIQGVLNEQITYPMATWYSPNVLILDDLKRPQMSADGTYLISYSEFPELIIIKPKSVCTVKIYNPYATVKESDWTTYGIVSLAVKKEMDSIVSIFYQKRIKEYKKAMKFSIENKAIFRYNVPEPEHDKRKLLDRIKDVFKIRINN